MSSPVNLKHPSEGAAIGAQVAKAVAWVSGIFSLVACISLIVNQIQIMQVDPLNDATLKALKAQIPKDLNNQQLRESVRNLSFMTRRSFFTNQTTMRATGLMLLFGVAIFLASIKTYVELRLKLPVPMGQPPKEGGTAERTAYRWAVGAGAGVIVFLTLLLVFISPPDFDLMKEDRPAEEKTASATSEAKASESKPDSKPADVKSPDAKPAEPALKPVEGTKAPAPSSSSAVIPANAWPSFRGPQGLATAHHKNAPLVWTPESVLWKKPIPKFGANSPIVWGDQVFVAGADEASRDIFAYNAKTGELQWTAPTKLVTGTLPKSFEGTGYCPATLTTDGERVYGVFATGDVVAFAMDGKKAWSRNLGTFKNSYGHASSLLTLAGRLLVQFDHEGGGRLIAMDSKSGKTVWEQPRAVKSSWASPILIPVGAQTQVVLCGNPLVTGHDPDTGKILWQIECMSGEVAPSPAFAGGRLFVGTQGMALTALQPGASDVKKLWEYEGDLPDASSPVATEKYVIMTASGGVVTCLNAATGKMVWTHDFDEGFNASPIIVDDRVYVTDKKGNTVVLKVDEKFEQLAFNSLGEAADSTAAIPEGRIYLRGPKNLYCIGKDAR
ncbi:MAG TPA: PQQ-binding-like beta-propeller repeat protein [Planctomycetota bacterium]|nr:PQQ-binding-like beta-propeller repeat protein [Planctomycetota bacterium]